MSFPTLDGKSGIVTSGSNGIGFVVSNVLVEAGAAVYVISRSVVPEKDTGVSAEGIVHLKGDMCFK